MKKVSENDVPPLRDIKVVDFSNFVAGPVVGKILADWGAEVFKIERFEGDPWRWYGVNYQLPCQPDENPLFDLENLNKKFVALNLKTRDGMEIMHRLISRADIFVTNFRTDALKKMQLSYEDLAPRYPQLIFGQIEGFGAQGPDAKRAGFDVVAYWARSGAMIDLVPAEVNVPITAPFGFGDHVTGATLVGGICAALFRRERTSRGDKVSISLYGNAIFNVGSMVLSAQTKYGNPFPRYRSQPTNAAGTTYKCRDGKWIMLSILEYERYWPILCEKVLDKPELAKDERFKTKTAAKENRGAGVDILEKIFLTKTSDEWAKLLNEADIAFEKIAQFKDVTSDGQAWANDYLFNHLFKNKNSAILPRTPITFESFKIGNPAPETRIGEHTRDVLLGLEYTPSQIEELEKGNIIKCAS